MSDFANGYDRGVDSCTPTFSVMPVAARKTVSLATWFYGGGSHVSLSPAAARLLAVQLSRAADEAESINHDALQDAARAAMAGGVES